MSASPDFQFDRKAMVTLLIIILAGSYFFQIQTSISENSDSEAVNETTGNLKKGYANFSNTVPWGLPVLGTIFLAIYFRETILSFVER